MKKNNELLQKIKAFLEAVAKSATKKNTIETKLITVKKRSAENNMI
jgi:hypothetical protein